MTKLAVIALVTGLIVSVCREGCLKCVGANQCQVCDFQKNFYLLGFSCEKINQANCVLPDIEGKCVTCTDKHYVDFNSGTCVKVNESSEILNCKVYQSAVVCLSCENGFYLNEEKCEAVPSAIENCVVYQSGDPTFCSLCQSGFIRAQDGKSCYPEEPIDNCALYELVKCNQCETGFILDNNKYFDDLFKTNTESGRLELYNYLNTVIEEESPDFSLKVCRKVIVENCEKYLAFNKCGECADGYYLNTDNECVVFPEEPIENCEVYTTPTTCISCKQLFKLENEQLCSPITEIENCKLYDTTASDTQCKECVDGMYVQNNICSPRINSLEISNCRAKKTDSDVCAECGDNYYLTDDNLACLIKIASCLTYQASTKDTADLICASCVNGYYLNQTDNKCVVGSVDNCYSYQPQADTCETCKNKYYLSNAACEPHNLISNCKSYSKTIQDECISCEDKHILFNQVNTCIKQAVIENCETQLSSTECSVCRSGFVLTATGTCTTFESDVNCISVNGVPECTSCKDGFVLWQPTKKCVSAFEYESEFCESLQKQDENSFDCAYCKEKSFPVKLVEETVCLKEDELIINTKPDNCVEVEIVNNAYVCTECGFGYYLKDSDKLCYDSCADTIVLLNLSFTTNNTTKKGYKNTCKDITMPNCKVAAQSFLTASEEYVCIECKAGQFPQYNFAGTPTTGLHAYYSVLDIYKVNLFDYFNPVDCGNPATLLFNPGSVNTPIENCELYRLDSDILTCIRCSYGYTGIADNGFIQSCSTIITNCDTNTRYKGLLHPKLAEYDSTYTPLYLFASCTKCLDSHFPVLFMNEDTATTLSYKPFATADDPPTLNTTATDVATQCLELSDLNFFLTEGATFDSIPNYCGFILYYVNKTKSGDIANTPSIVCGACKPGYKPTFTNSVITACTAIENCEVGIHNLYFNKCAQCAAGNTWGWDDTTKSYDFSVCVGVTDENCEAYDSANSRCAYCVKGYKLNRDGVCDAINVPKCNLGNFIETEIDYSPTTVNLRINAYKAIKGSGCANCASGYLKLKTSRNICTESTYLKAESLVTNTSFIINCKHYTFDQSDSLICHTCIDNYIPNAANTLCHELTSSLSNCAVATSSTACSVCNSEYVLVGELCASEAIPNCLNYNQGSPSQTCTKCKSQYYLKDNECKKGTINNCDEYASESSCIACLTDYKLISLSGSTHYCFPLPLSMNCKTFNTQFTSLSLQCTECKQGYDISTESTDFSPKQCVGFLLINQCTEYDFKTGFSDSTLGCVKCSSNYYLSSGQCIQRKNKDINCIEYVGDVDKCKLCAVGHYLSDDEKYCVIFPQGIGNCERYLDGQTCTLCKKNHYLESNVCAIVLDENLVENCKYYKNGTECETCENGFVSVGGVCEQITALNCKTASNPVTCTSCQPGNGLKKENDQTDCVSLTDPNCLVSELTFPFTCKTCSSDYYVGEEDGICVIVENFIEGCSVYKDKETCSVCESNRILSQDKKSCVVDSTLRSKVDLYCVDTFINQAGSCIACKPGYFFSDTGSCIACSENTVESGCFSCDPQDQTKCLMCLTGYYMDNAFKCVSLDETVEMTNETPESATLLTVIVFFGSFLLLI